MAERDREADVFISYQRDTADKARKLADALRQNQRDVFIDLKLSSDAKWRADIERRLGRARCVVAIWSKKASTSGWVNYEAFRAQQEGKLIAVTFDPIRPDELPGWLTDQQITSLRDWRDVDQLHDGWMSVRRAVHAKCGKLPDYRFKGWLAGGPAHERVTSLAFHPTEDALLLSAGHEGGAAMWLASAANMDWRGKAEFKDRSTEEFSRYGQLSRATVPAPPREHQRNAVWRAQYSTSGDRVVLASRDGIARVYDRNLGTRLFELPHNARCGVQEMAFANSGGGQHRDGVLDATFTDDGLILTVGGSKAIFWNAQGEMVSPKPIGMPEGAPAMIVRALYCDAAKAVVIGDKLGKVRLISPSKGDIDGDEIADRADNVVHIALGPSISESRVVQGILAIVSQSALDSNIKFHTWTTSPDNQHAAFSAERPQQIRIETPPIRGIALHPNAPVIAVASNAVQPKLFDYEHNEPLPLGRSTDTFGWHDSATSAVAFSANGKYLAVGSDDGRISVWETRANAFSSSGGTAQRNRRAEDKN